MNTKLQVQVPVPITMLSDADIVAEINRRQILIKWARKAIPEPDNRGRSCVSPSCKQETWDCTKPGLVKKD
jgi:hypothetical protein